MERIVLAYSGDLDTSVAIPWLKEKYAADLIALTLDMGQGRPLEEVRERALAAGAVRAHVLDVRDNFAREYILRALKADVAHEERHPMSAPLGRPLIAQKLVEIADIEQATAVAHGGTGRGDEQIGLEVAVRALNPNLMILAPVRAWGMTHLEKIQYARERGVPLPTTVDAPSDVGANLWGRSVEYGSLADPWTEPPEDIYTLTNSPVACPDEPAYVEIAFERGVPTSINGVTMALVDLIGSLTVIAGAHGVGRIGRFECGPREVYEAPAAVALHAAHHELQKMVSARDVAHFSRVVSQRYADIVRRGVWFGPLRTALDAYVEKVQEAVTGVIRVKLFKGDCRIVGRKHSVGAGRQSAAGSRQPPALAV